MKALLIFLLVCCGALFGQAQAQAPSAIRLEQVQQKLAILGFELLSQSLVAINYPERVLMFYQA